MNTTTNKEGASSNKRSRGGGSTATASSTRGAASGGSAAGAATSALADTLGDRLMPLMGMLATQPDKTKGLIIERSRSMLDLRVTIKQRMASLARFDKPLKDPTTGQALQDERGNPLPFIPNSLRKKCPVESSKRMNDEPEMRTLMEEAKTEWDKCVKTMTNLAKRTAELEIQLHTKSLRHTFFDLIVMLARSELIVLEKKTGGRIDGLSLTPEQSANKAAYDALSTAGTLFCISVGVENGNKLMEAFSEYKSFNNRVIEEKMDTVYVDFSSGERVEGSDCEGSPRQTSKPDQLWIDPTITKLRTWIPILSVELWKHDDKRDMEREIEAALEEAFEPAAQRKANDDVEAAMDAEDTNAPSAKLMDAIRKEQKKLADKQMIALKREMRKNYSGDGRNDQPPSKPTKNGRESKHPSQPTSKKTGKKPAQPNRQGNKKGNGSKKKGGAAEEPSANARPSKKKRQKGAPRGGSSSDGKRGGAVRR